MDLGLLFRFQVVACPLETLVSMDTFESWKLVGPDC